MRKLFKKTIEEDDITSLLSLQSHNSRHDFIEIGKKIPSFQRIMDVIESSISEIPKWKFPSYFRIENRQKAHPIHYDGCKLDFTPNHMSWCRYSAVSLLTNNFENGTLRFFDPIEEFETDLYLNTIVYSSHSTNKPQKHERDKHLGNRFVLLMFIATEKS